MKRPLRVVATAAATTAALFLVGIGSLPAAANDGRTLHFEVQFSPFFYLDLGAQGPSMGDQIVAHDLLFDRNGNQVGHDGVSCVMTDPAGETEAECTATYSLPGGQLTSQFLNTPPSVKHLAITGGTGTYRNARGEAVLTERGNQTGTLVIKLTG